MLAFNPLLETLGKLIFAATKYNAPFEITKNNNTLGAKLFLFKLLTLETYFKAHFHFKLILINLICD